MDKVTALKHKPYPSIYRKIRWSFGFITLTIFSIFWLFVYFAEDGLEILSLHHWLDSEATLYQQNYQNLGANAPLPNELEFDSYWSQQTMPEWLREYQQPGFYEHVLGEEDKHFVVTAHPSGEGLMYIVFQDDADDYLDQYETSLHHMTFVVGGLFTIITVGYGVYMVRMFSSPLAKIEKKISQMPPDQPSFGVDTQFSETRHIEQTLLNSKQIIASYFKREQEFSRFASHELRTPIMVIRGSTDILARIPDQPAIAQKAIARLQSACSDMRMLTDAFLLLGKESIESQHYENKSLLTSLQQQLAELELAFAKQNTQYQLTYSHPESISAPESFVAIVINNLIKNAFSYSIGDINIGLNRTRLSITNLHQGNETYNEGYGCGIVIVERICERMGWSVELTDDGERFTAVVEFS